jgi:23S rRNA (pseudouridine1915-N3)-methyltransferase
MQITIIAGGLLKAGPLQSLVQEYEKRLSWNVSVKEIPEGPPQKTAALFLEKLPSSAFVIGLDEEGENISSQELASFIQQKQLSGFSHLCFLIGPADGLHELLDGVIQKKIAFGKATWPHLFVRLLLMEQLYRAQQILKGHPYHRG